MSEQLVLAGDVAAAVAVGTAVATGLDVVTGKAVAVAVGATVGAGTDGVTGVAPGVAAGAAVAAGVGVAPTPVSCSPAGRVATGVGAVVVNGDGPAATGLYGEGVAAANDGLGTDAGVRPAKFQMVSHHQVAQHHEKLGSQVSLGSSLSCNAEMCT